MKIDIRILISYAADYLECGDYHECGDYIEEER